MKTNNIKKAARAAIAAFLLFAATTSPFAQQRLVLGGKAVIMVADAVYLFPDVGRRVIAVAGADQGLGTFLSAIDSSFLKKPVIDKTAGVEAYASLKPDTVILKAAMKKSLGPSLDALGIKQVYLNLETPEDYEADIARLGDFLGQKARADEIVSFYRNALAEIAKRVEKAVAQGGGAVQGASVAQGAFAAQGAGKAAKPKVLLVQAANPTEGVWEVPPASWMQTRLVELAGGIPVWMGANPGSGWAKVNPEQIAAWNPDAVFVVNYRANAAASARIFSSDARLSRVAAVKNGAVYGFAQDFYSWDQPDTRWIIGLEWMAGKLYPAQFADKPILAEARAFFSIMYGMDAAAFDATVAPKLAGDLND
ncbi:MAG TPA: ABC transporter substrate-binding protein [Rectinemataceae bacterium]|nr:ABC transporter substrate-binding protein [Rectinemataceae bacterium]